MRQSAYGKIEMNRQSKIHKSLWLAAAIPLVFSGHAFAQDTTDARTSKPKDLSAVIVTGTRADDRTESSSLTPIDVVSAKVLQQTGTSELSTALARIIPSLSFPRPSAADTADSQRPAQLRGLSPDQVLVLVDGKRWHPGAIILTNGVLGRGSQAVDLNTIPMAAIDHIEVLRDGASAQYGSDAIAGVINVVLKKGATGGDVELSGGQYSAGDGRMWQGSANFGIPLNNDKGWLRFTLQDGHQDITNRAGIDRRRPQDGIRQRFGDPEVRDRNVFFNSQYDLTPGVQLYAFGHYGNRKSTSTAFFRSVANSNASPTIYPDGYLPLENADSTDQALVFGVRGRTEGGWRWDVSGNAGGNRVSYGTQNSVNRAFLNDFGVSPTRFHDGILQAKQQAFDIDIAKEMRPSWLPNPVTVAFGTEYLRQSYEIRAGDPASYYTGTSGISGGAQGFGGYQPVNAGAHARHSVSEYLSLETNLTDRLGTSLAVRHEDYSDFGTTTSGSLAGRFDFTDRFAVRASASTGFRAPSLAQQYYSYTSSLYYGPGNSLGLPADIYNTGLVASTSPIGRLLGGEPLKPEKSRNYTVGLVWNPVDALKLSLDVYQIDLRDRITLSSNLATTSPAVRGYLAANGITNTNTSGIAYFTNAVGTRTRGVDFVGSYLFDMANAGTLQTTLSYNYNKNKVTDIKANPAILNSLGINLNRIDRRDQFGLLADTTPRSKLILNGLYSIGNWNLNGTLTRYAKFVAYNSTSPARDETFGSKWLLDLALNYNVDRWTFTLGGDNVLNTYPDKASAALNNDNNGTFPYSVFSPFGFNGAYVYGKVAYRW
jgi:iron complex outermembrane receptor protein